MRRPFLAGNWKMHLGQEEALGLARGLAERLGAFEDRDVAIFPTMFSVAGVHAALADSPVRVGAQNCHDEDKGAFTGEVSAPILASAGVDLVLLGHSERRHVFGEDEAFIARKLRSVLAAGLEPMLCVGETLPEREAGQTLAVVERQLRTALEGVGEAEISRIHIAYEPVWAIGTGKVATPEQAQEVHAAIRGLMGQLHGEAGQARRILYGGSVKPGNVAGLMSCEDIDGALVGGASLDLESFLGIVNFDA